MKKNYILLSGLVLASCLSFGQNRIAPQTIEPAVESKLTDKVKIADPDLLKKPKFTSKAFGDTLYTQDFANGLPTGWSIVNNNANNFQWKWSLTYDQGQFSMGTNAIASTTAANGFMSLPGDFYNTPIPGTGAVAMDTYFESDTIFVTPQASIWVTYQQYLRYCCSGANRLVLQVSTDNFATFQEYDATNDIAVNASNTTNAMAGTTNIINISSAAANSSQFKIRFLSEGNSHYFWMIDDFAVIEGPANDMELRTPYMEFNEANYTYYPFYGQIPYNLFPPLPLFGTLYNNGSNAQTNAQLVADVTHTAFPGGGAGTGLVYTGTSTPIASLAPDQDSGVLTNNPRFVPLVLGDFQVDFLATSDSTDENIGNETNSQTFTTSDTVYARDDSGFGGGTGTGSYVRGGSPGGTAVGDRYGAMYIVESRTGNGLHTRPTSVTYRVSTDVANIGVEIVPKMWEYDEDSLGTIDQAFGAEVASSFIPYTVAAADTGTFLTLTFDNGTGYLNGLDSGQYVVGYEVTSIAGGTNFEILNDGSSAALQAPVTCFVYFGHSPGWGWVRDNPGIRLNMRYLPIPTGISTTPESTTKFEVAPNPNNGLFSLKINTEVQATYNLNIRNMIGQSVYTDIINVNGQLTENLDLTKFEKGVYFVSLENDAERILKKVVIK